MGDYDKQKKISKNRGETEEHDDYGKPEVKKSKIPVPYMHKKMRNKRERRMSMAFVTGMPDFLYVVEKRQSWGENGKFYQNDVSVTWYS